MLKFLLVIVSLLVCLQAETAPLFGVVRGVADNDTLNVRLRPDHKSRKIGALPPDALVGIDRCKKIGRSRWYQIHHIAQRDYAHYGYDVPRGWVNAKYLEAVERGYVLVDHKGKCDYVLRCSGNKCLLVTSVDLDTQGNVTKLHTAWIRRNRLYGESNFGAAADNSDGYCTIGSHIEKYLRHKRHTHSPVRYKTFRGIHFSLDYPMNMRLRRIKDGVSIDLTIPLKHISGSDMRDNPPVLNRYVKFFLNIVLYSNVASAIKASGCEPSMYQSGRYFGLKGRRCEIGVEGAGVVYYILAKSGKIILVASPYDHNPPLDPRTNQPISGDWRLKEKAAITKKIVESVRIK